MQKLAEICIRRPVFASMIILTLVVVGAAGYLNLDVDRFNGTPEMKALLHGSLSRYQQRYGKFSQPLSVVVGLPNEVLTGDLAEQNRHPFVAHAHGDFPQVLELLDIAPDAQDEFPLR